MKTEDKLRRVFALILEAVRKDENLIGEIDRILAIPNGRSGSVAASQSKAQVKVPRNRRKPAAFDPFTSFEEGEPALRSRLANLDLEELKDIVAEFGMDQAKLVSKWKDRERVIGHIIETVRTRSKKGDAFRS